MSGDAGHMTPPGPTPVPIHNDGDVLGKTRRVQPQVNIGFLAVQTSRNRVSQAELSESKLTQEISCVQCDRTLPVISPKRCRYPLRRDSRPRLCAGQSSATTASITPLL